MSFRFLLGITALFALLTASLLWADLKEELNQKEEILRHLTAREEAILKELEDLARKIEAKRREVERLEDEIATRKISLRQLVRKVEEKDQQLKALEHLFRQRLRALATTGRLGWLNLLLSPSEVSSFLRREEYAFLILEHDRLLAQRIAQEKENLLKEQERLLAEEKRLQQLKKELELEREALEKLQKEKQALLEEVRRNKRLYAETLRTLKAAYLAIEQMAEELKATRQALRKAQEEAERVKKEKTSPFPRPPLIEVKGYLLPPVQGEVVRFFGLERDPVTGEEVYEPGITISAPPGTPVRAPYGGRVVRVSSVRGKGFVVFIDHGYHFLSVIGGLGKVRVTLGEEVKTGEVIGEVGALPFGPEGVYYELRYKDRPRNPLDWLDTSKLRFLR